VGAHGDERGHHDDYAGMPERDTGRCQVSKEDLRKR
jgi:hypothetical protein